MKAHAIFVVVGSTGEYSDHTEWPVCWRHTAEDARAVAEKLEAEADEFQRYRGEEDYDARRAGMLDAGFQDSYTSTRYTVWTVLDDPRGTP